MVIDLLVCCALGFLSSSGVGGGSLLLLWLTAIRKIDFTAARTINLIFFIPPAAITLLSSIFKKQFSAKQILPAAFGGCIASLFFSRVSQNWNTVFLRKLYGVFLLFSAIRELRVKKQQPHN